MTGRASGHVKRNYYQNPERAQFYKGLNIGLFFFYFPSNVRPVLPLIFRA
jgi:hypothetical protein